VTGEGTRQAGDSANGMFSARPAGEPGVSADLTAVTGAIGRAGAAPAGLDLGAVAGVICRSIVADLVTPPVASAFVDTQKSVGWRASGLSDRYPFGSAPGWDCGRKLGEVRSGAV